MMQGVTIITITTMPSMPWRYCCDYKRDGKGKTYSTQSAGNDPAAAAAYAMSIALSCSKYMIFAPQSVLSLIPSEVQRKL